MDKLDPVIREALRKIAIALLLAILSVLGYNQAVHSIKEARNRENRN